MKASEILQEIFRLNGITTEHYNWLMREVKELEKEHKELKEEMKILTDAHEDCATQCYHDEKYVEIGKVLEYYNKSGELWKFKHQYEIRIKINKMLKNYREEVNNESRN
jgi:hypothetical protein